MAESYDSIGNQVIRNFRHYIDPQRHYWLKSEQKFPPPSVFETQLSGEQVTVQDTTASCSSASVTSTNTSI